MKKRVLIALAAAVILAAALTGCGKRESTVAEINGQKVTADEFVRAIAQSRLSPQAGIILSHVLEDKLFLGMARDKKVEPTDAQINQRLDMLKKTQDMEQQLKDSGLTIDDAKEQLRALQARINLAEEAMKEEVTDEDVKRAYDAQKSQRFDLPERIRTALVVFPSKEATDKAAKSIKGGATLEKVAKDAGMRVGHLPVPKSDRNLPPELTKAAWDTPKGKTSQPISIKGMMGEQWVILSPGEKLPAVKVSFDQAKPVVRGEVMLDKANQDSGYQKRLENARKKAKITISMRALEDAEKLFRQPAASFGPMGGMP